MRAAGRSRFVAIASREPVSGLLVSCTLFDAETGCSKPVDWCTWVDGANKVSEGWVSKTL